MPDFLVEIGTEELPPMALASLAVAFNDAVHAGLEAAGLRPPEQRQNEYFYSPRRLAVRVRDVAARQPDRVEERLGPAVAAAFDADGAPTAAAAGFARSCGVAVDALARRVTDKGERLAHSRTVPGLTASELLTGIVREALQTLPIPRRMRWGAGDVSFVRPVHWVLMLFGGDVVAGEVLGVRTGRMTHGHRFHHPAAIEIKSAAAYEARLRKPGRVLVNDAADSLNAAIVKQAAAAAASVDGTLATADPESALVREIAALVEWPVPVVGGFDADFLALPDEVIVAVLEGQQRYFPVRDAGGQLAARFVAIANIDSADPATVRHGNERVVRPRLADAMFFWRSDLATPLATRAGELERVVFQAGLGSLADKSARIAALAPAVAPGDGIDAAALARAAALCKADLVTGMVGEFPELQGVMGGYYAAAGGEAESVAAAIREHYLPRKADDAIPASPPGQRLAIADKLDAIAGAFALGRRPSGDKDPFAVRRQAAAILRIALEAPLDFDLAALIDAALAAQPAMIEDAAAMRADILAFFMDRLRSLYTEQGVRGDVIEAVLALDIARPLALDVRIRALNDFVDQPAARSLAAANKRTANILRQAGAAPARVDPKAFTAAAETALYDAMEAKRGRVDELVKTGEFPAALAELAALRAVVDRFFEEVLVMAEDAAERRNRLALLAALQELFRRTADWARIQVE